MKDEELLARDKYDGDERKVTLEDRTRLAAGEPLAYVIGWLPFLGLRIGLGSRPLIPRPETEWWTQELITHLKERFGEGASGKAFSFLDLCAGSGAVGLAVLKEFPNARVSFGELKPEHCEQIQANIELNGLDAGRADIRASSLFSKFKSGGRPERFDVIATNPPYVPSDRELEKSVAEYEPQEALYSGPDGLRHIAHIAQRAEQHLYSGGELWMECDISNVARARDLVQMSGSEPPEILTDLYGRERVVVAYFP